MRPAKPRPSLRRKVPIVPTTTYPCAIAKNSPNMLLTLQVRTSGHGSVSLHLFNFEFRDQLQRRFLQPSQRAHSRDSEGRWLWRLGQISDSESVELEF